MATVASLIAQLQAMPPDATVSYLWDGAPRSDANLVWLARSGTVIIADYGDVCYDLEDRPTDAPDERYWSAPEDPCTEDCTLCRET